MDATFNEQRTLDDFRLGMGDEKREIEGMKRRIKEDKVRNNNFYYFSTALICKNHKFRPKIEPCRSN